MVFSVEGDNRGFEYGSFLKVHSNRAVFNFPALVQLLLRAGAPGWHSAPTQSVDPGQGAETLISKQKTLEITLPYQRSSRRRAPLQVR
jgi:hypothetical protein